ncbi:MAG: hypothetical protein ACAI35_11260 [Candidatus Methylacidiphilales bacterium]|nr:hypothetical protein [Candidatus Methylacidiphilales bacterium]
MVSLTFLYCRRCIVAGIASARAAVAVMLMLGAFLMLPMLVHAQQPNQPEPTMFDKMPNGQSISGIYYPVEKDGVLIQEMRGSKATKMSGGRVDVKDLNLKRYKNGALEMVLIMPLANFYVQDQKLATDRGVMIQFSDREVRADEMVWDLRSNSGSLKKNVKVVLKNFDLGSSKQTPAGTAPAAPVVDPTQGGTLPLPSITLPTDNTLAPGATQNGQPVQPGPIPDAAPPASTGSPGDIVLPTPASPTAP